MGRTVAVLDHTMTEDTLSGEKRYQGMVITTRSFTNFAGSDNKCATDDGQVKRLTADIGCPAQVSQSRNSQPALMHTDAATSGRLMLLLQFLLRVLRFCKCLTDVKYLSTARNSGLTETRGNATAKSNW